MPEEQRRVFLGKKAGLGSIQRVYRIAEGLEVDDVENYVVTQKRVFYDDVLLVTYHQSAGTVFLLLTGGAAALVGLVALAVAGSWGATPGLVLFSLAGLPFALAFVLRLALGMDVVTVHGRRTMAQMHFLFRKKRARQVFQDVCRFVRGQQERVAR